MLDLKTLKVGDDVRVVNNIDNNVGKLGCVNIGDVGTVISNDVNIGGDRVLVESKSWDYNVYFFPHQLENVSPSEDLIIYKSRWDEIIDNLHKPLNFMTDEEVEVIKAVLKNNVPFNVVEKPVVIDPVIEKEQQTHLDANFVGMQGNPCFYYRSYTLKQWFYWNESSEWEECDFDYEDVNDMLLVSFGINLGESK